MNPDGLEEAPVDPLGASRAAAEASSRPAGVSSSPRICALCTEPILPGEDRADIVTMDAHRECALRMALGGIGHLIDHSHFCRGVGPDAGLDRRTSALMVDVWVSRNGVEAATRIMGAL